MCVYLFKTAAFSMPNPTSKKHLEAKAFYLASLEVQMFYHNWYLVWDISQKKIFTYIINHLLGEDF